MTQEIQVKKEDWETEIKAHMEALCVALKTGDKKAGLVHQARLTEAAAQTLLDQDVQAMRVLRIHFAKLAVLTDRLGWYGSGQYWWALDKVLFCCEYTYHPLEQIRLLADTNGWPRKVFEAIAKNPGITPDELSSHFGITLQEIRKFVGEDGVLVKEGLILRQPAGGNVHLHVVMNQQSLPARLYPLKELLDTLFPDE